MNWARLDAYCWKPQNQAEYQRALDWFSDNLKQYTKLRNPTTQPLLKDKESFVRFTELGVTQNAPGDYVEVYYNWAAFKSMTLACCPVGHTAKTVMTEIEF